VPWRAGRSCVAHWVLLVPLKAQKGPAMTKEAGAGEARVCRAQDTAGISEGQRAMKEPQVADVTDRKQPWKLCKSGCHP
jgi:hypothetical protein